jgi:uncharacterized protein
MELKIIPVDSDDHLIIYRPLIGLAFIGNQSMADYCVKHGFDLPKSEGSDNKEIIRFLLEIGFFLPDNEPSYPDLIATSAVLLLTNRCQLKCTYCYASAGESEPKKLSRKSGIAVIDFVCNQAAIHNRGSFKVEFHGGGEPSLEWQLLQYLVQYARRKSIPAEISLTSNAIWTVPQCEWITRNIDKLSISMDGTPETQNHQRPFRNNQPSSGFVMKNLHRLDALGFTAYGIRMTVCDPWIHLGKDVKFIYENTKCRSIQVEPAFNILRGTHLPPSENQYAQFAKAFLDAYDLSKELGARLTYSGARPGVISRNFCSSPFNALVVNPDDCIVACYEITNSKHPLAEIASFGKIQDDMVHIDEQKRTHFHDLLGERFNTVCKDCFCRWTCAGDCFSRAFPESGGHLSSSSRCLMNREITKNMILNLIYQQQGVWQSFSPKDIPDGLKNG